MNDLATIIHNQKPTFLSVRSDPLIEFEREAGFALQVLGANEFLGKVAFNNPGSLANAINNVAAVGISLNPASKLAYLVPRDGRICLDISYMGLMHIAQQSGAIVWGQSRTVRENDVFQMEGIDKPPTHTFNPFGTEEERGPLIGAYVVVKTDTGDYLTHAMPIAQIYAIRDRSEAWKRGQRGPWKTDAEEMIKKTVVKQAAKMWPRRDRLDSAIHNLNTDGEGITFEGDVRELMAEETVLEWIDAIKATTTKADAKAKFHEAMRACEAVKDIDAAQRIKAELLAHGEALDANVTPQDAGSDDSDR